MGKFPCLKYGHGKCLKINPETAFGHGKHFTAMSFELINLKVF